MRTDGTAPATRSEWSALFVLLGFTAVALVGYGAFALDPARIPDVSGLWAFYAVSFPFFGRSHVVLTAAILAFVLVGRAGLRWLPAFAAVATASFLAEYVGTGWGLPFGEYAYTGLLGHKLGGRVPVLIPVSWFVMAVPAYALARAAFPSPRTRSARLLFGSLTLTAWDLALDPAMSFLTPFWSWADTGPFYGMPWVNLVGWMITGLVLMGVTEWLAGAWVEALPLRWLGAFYLTVLAMPLGMCVMGGLWGAVGATAVALGLLGSVVWTRRVAFRALAPAERPDPAPLAKESA